MEFRLVYEGDLFAHNDARQQGRAQHKHAIRKAFHKQLKALWSHHPVLIAHRSLQHYCEIVMNEPADDFVQNLAEAIAKQVPVRDVYEDGLSKPTKQTGELLTDIVKTLRLALFPVQALSALQDRYSKFIDRSIRQVPEQQRTPPAPQILGPVMEAIRYEPADTPIDEMFSELLSRAMDNERVNEAHPAYPFLIRQLSSDEARILAALFGRTYDRVHTSDYDRNTNLFSGHKVEIDDLPRDNLDFPQNVSFYMTHLANLGFKETRKPSSMVREASGDKAALGSAANTCLQS
jgi:hypothetical protein